MLSQMPIPVDEKGGAQVKQEAFQKDSNIYRERIDMWYKPHEQVPHEARYTPTV